MAQLVKNPPAMRETWVRSLGQEDSLEKKWLPTPVSWPGDFHGLFHGVGKSQTLLSDFHFLNPMHMSLSNLQETAKDKEAWHAAVPGVSKSWTQLSD